MLFGGGVCIHVLSIQRQLTHCELAAFFIVFAVLKHCFFTKETLLP